jgi:hypothetical protein
VVADQDRLAGGVGRAQAAAAVGQDDDPGAGRDSATRMGELLTQVLNRL